MRSELLEELATIDEENEGFMTKVFEAPETLTAEEINAAIRKGVCSTNLILFFAVLPSKIKGFNNFSMLL